MVKWTGALPEFSRTALSTQCAAKRASIDFLAEDDRTFPALHVADDAAEGCRCHAHGHCNAWTGTVNQRTASSGHGE